jgi:hypothetical protein
MKLSIREALMKNNTPLTGNTEGEYNMKVK